MAKKIKIKVKDYNHPDYKHLKLIYEIEFDEDDLGNAIQEVLNPPPPPTPQVQQSENDKNPKDDRHPHTRPIPTNLTADFKDVFKAGSE